MQQVGTWLSLVERTLGVGEVASSNLVVPTNISNYLAFANMLCRANHGAPRVHRSRKDWLGPHLKMLSEWLNG